MQQDFEQQQPNSAVVPVPLITPSTPDEVVASDVSSLAKWVDDPSHGWDTRSFTGQELEFVVVNSQTLRPAKVSLNFCLS